MSQSRPQHSFSVRRRRTVLVTGAAGFIGSHLVRYLKSLGYRVRGVDIRQPEFGPSAADEFLTLDLRELDGCLTATRGVDEVYALAADMGGMGYISANHSRILRNNALINLHTLEAARRNGASRYLFTSSACVYPEYRQVSTDAVPLREEDAYPAQPQDAYGWEKLITEQLAHHYRKQYGFDTRTVRFHNIFGPLGTWEGGREKAPAAMCRKVAVAKLTGNAEVEIWGDGEQTRSFMYITDCLKGTQEILHSDILEPINLGSAELVSINTLVDIVEQIAGVKLKRRYNLDAPKGVRGRNSDNTLICKYLGWEPGVPLREGMEKTYRWIYDQMKSGKQSVVNVA